jgi:type II secretory pathway pseudopilin PulG
VTTLEIVILVVVLVIAALVVGGFVASGRRARADEGARRAELEAANQALAMARAQDRGWERSLLEEACRAAFAQRSPAEIRELELVQVVDRPGTEEDQAVFRVVTDHGSEYLHLDRRGDAWVAR